MKKGLLGITIIALSSITLLAQNEIDALRYSKHDAHLSVDEAILIAKKVGSKRTILTHMGSDLKYTELLRYLPKGIEPGYDGLVVNL